MSEGLSELKTGYCVFIDTFFQGPVLTVSDENGYIVFKTESEAQREIVDNLMIRLQQFLDGDRDYDDAITIEEYIVPVMEHPDGVISDEQGRCFGRRPE